MEKKKKPEFFVSHIAVNWSGTFFSVVVLLTPFLEDIRYIMIIPTYIHLQSISLSKEILPFFVAWITQGHIPVKKMLLIRSSNCSLEERGRCHYIYCLFFFLRLWILLKIQNKHCYFHLPSFVKEKLKKTFPLPTLLLRDNIYWLCLTS